MPVMSGFVGPRPPLPEWMTDPSGWWSKLSPQERQEVLNSLGEFTGGTAGSLAGGAGGSAILPGPGTFAGGAIGSGIGTGVGRVAANKIGPMMGASGPGPDESQKLAEAIALGGTVEAATRGIPIVGRAITKGIKSTFKQTTAAKIITDLAKEVGFTDKAGNPLLDVAQSSGSEFLKSLKLLFKRYPISSGGSKKLLEEQGAKFQSRLKNLFDSFSKGDVDAEKFTQLARTELTKMRNALGAQTRQAAETASKKFDSPPVLTRPEGVMSSKGRELIPPAPAVPEGPTFAEVQGTYDKSRLGIPPARRIVGPESSLPTPPPAAAPSTYVHPTVGTESLPPPVRSGARAAVPVVTEASSARDAIMTNQAAMRAWYKKTIAPLMKDPAYNAQVDTTRLQSTARHLLDADKWAEVAGTLQGRQKKILQRLAGLAEDEFSAEDAIQDKLTSAARNMGGKSADDLPPAIRQMIIDDYGAEVAAKAPKPDVITFDDLDNLRSELLEVSRGETFKSSAAARKSLSSVIKEVNNTLSGTATKNPKFYAKWRAAKSRYRDMTEKVGERTNTSTKFPTGNPVVEPILKAKDAPHKVFGEIVEPGAKSLVRQGRAALDPTSVGRPPETFNPFNEIPNIELSRARQAATKSDVLSGEPFLSPAAYRDYLTKTLGGTEREMFGRGLPAVENVYSPAMLGREHQLFQTPLAKRLEGTSAEGVIESAFPSLDPATTQATLNTFATSGINPSLQRGYAENVVKFPTGQFEKFNPVAARTRLVKEGSTAPTVMGTDRARSLNKLLELGEAIAPSAMEEVGGSGRAYAAQQLGQRVVNAPSSPGAVMGTAAFLGGTIGGSRLMFSPKVANWLTTPAKDAFSTNALSGTGAGMVARSLTQLPPRPVTETVPAPSAPAGQIEMISPDGQRGYVPAEYEDYMLSNGYKRP